MCRQSVGIPTLCNALIINAVHTKSAECRQNQQIQSLGGMQAKAQVKTLPQNANVWCLYFVFATLWRYQYAGRVKPNTTFAAWQLHHTLQSAVEVLNAYATCLVKMQNEPLAACSLYSEDGITPRSRRQQVRGHIFEVANYCAKLAPKA